MKRTTILVLALGALLTTQHVYSDDAQREATKLRMTEGKVLFEEKCKTVAGEKIYKTVADVEGLLLLKVRPKHGEREQSDWMWPGAAFAREARGDQYITNFLAAEVTTSDGKGGRLPITQKDRGLVTPVSPEKLTPADRPGYRWVEVLDEKDGKRYRYVLVEKPRPTSKIGWVDIVLDKSPAPGAAPRYGVTFEDHVIPEERQRGLASSMVKVLDLQTGEVLGEMLRYAWSPGATSPANPTPWLTAYRCPDLSFNTGSATRKFVDQILLPKKGQ